MHCRDAELKQILGASEHNDNSPAVENHLGQCAVCQSRLAELSGDQCISPVEWQHLRTAAQEDLLCSQVQTAVTIELTSMLSEQVSMDFETIDLNFLDTPSHPELLGRLGRYDVERVVGSGGMGIVLKAHDTELNRVVAIKVLSPHLANSSSARRRFSREARAAAAVLHPNVLPIFNVESEGRLPYFVMQFVAGPSLQARVDRDGPLEISTALRIARQTAAALTAAHTQGLVHRDVKPANILLEEGVDRVQLSDFGLARTVDDASLTRTGIVAGTPHYMSPEQANGESIDARSDLFSLGCTLYFMLAGRPPFRAESTMAVLNRICHHPHRPLSSVNSAVPRELSQLVDRLLSKRAAKRFESAEAVESALERLLAAIQEGRLSIESRPLRNTRGVWSIAAAAVLVTLAVLISVPKDWLPWFQTNRGLIAPQLNSVAPQPHSHSLTTGVSRLAGAAPLQAAGQLHAGSASNRPLPTNTTSLLAPAVIEPQLEPASAELQFDTEKIFAAEDQWKRDIRELAAKLETASAHNVSWTATESVSASSFAARIAALANQLDSCGAVAEKPTFLYSTQ